MGSFLFIRPTDSILTAKRLREIINELLNYNRIGVHAFSFLWFT